MNKKYYIYCKQCALKIKDFAEWFKHNQKCPECFSSDVEVIYYESANKIKEIIQNKDKGLGLWNYIDFLPLKDKKNIVSFNEGAVSIDNWTFLEDYAKEKFNISCKIFAYRNDENYATGTFKDIAASLIVSVLKENNINEYCVPSTGNMANALAFYSAQAGISLSVFIPEEALELQEAEISSYGQRVFKVKGDYARAKQVAKEYSQKHNILISLGNTDPLRVEAKKIMLFDWIKQLKYLPSVYIQALSGGTGPIAIEKGFREIKNTGLADKLPRFILSQPSGCNPMAKSWEKAKKQNFPQNWENSYDIIENPRTKVPTLANGLPATYPIIAKLVRETGGEILTFDENKFVDIAKLVAYKVGVRIGPASAIAVGGLLEALKNNYIKNEDTVLINIGEGTRRSPEMLINMNYTTQKINSIDDCQRFSRASLENELWKNI